MQKNTIALMVAAAAIAVMFGACASERNGRGRGPDGAPPGGPGGAPMAAQPGGPGGPGGNGPGDAREARAGVKAPEGAETALLGLKALIEAEKARAELSLSAEQIEAILPVLEEWLAALEADPRADGAPYAKKIAAVLSAKQKSFRPEPPRGGGPQGGPPPAGGPGGNAEELLQELIAALEG